MNEHNLASSQSSNSPPFCPAWRSTPPQLASDPEPVAPALQKTVVRAPPAVLAAPLPAVPISD